MSRSICFLVFLLLFNPLFLPRADSQEFISGQILELDVKKMEIIITSGENQKSDTSGAPKILIRIANDNFFQRYNGVVVFPECVKPGNWIRIWGYRGEDLHDVIFAHDIKGCADGGCADPTGTMARLKGLMGVSQKNSSNKGDGSKGTVGDSGNGSGRGNGSGGGSGSGNGNGSGGGGGGNGSGSGGQK